MKKLKALTITLIMLFVIGPGARAQFEDFDFFNAGVEDGIELFSAYATPWINAFGTDLNGGWYNSAKPHKLGGFDITFTTSVTTIPDADRVMDLSKLSFNDIIVDPDGTGNTMASTVAGENKDGAMLAYYEDVNGTPVEVARFKSPPGSGVPYFPAPMIQGSVGLPYGTEIVGRFFPTVKVPMTNAKVGLWGIGVKHSVLQYFKRLDKLPIDVSVFGGYTKLHTNVAISVQPSDVLPPGYEANVVLNEYALSDFQDQAVDVATQGYNLSLIASTTLPIINVYGSLGYSNANTQVLIDGPIPTPTVNIDDPMNPHPEVNDSSIEKIPGFEVENKSGLRSTIGLRLKMGPISFHGDYTYAKYSVFTGGIGVNFR